METRIKRTALNITTYCNLNCKHCLAFIPYYNDKHSMSIEEARGVLNVYQILNEVFLYEQQITGSVDFVTNGTIEISEEILRLFEAHRKNTKVVLSNYGVELSTKINVIEEELKRRNINYRVSKFYGNDLYYDGWIDFSDHSKKWNTIEERDKNAQKCVHRVGKYFVINAGEIHCCSRSFWRIHEGIIPKIEGEYVALMDEEIPLEQKRKDLMEMYEKKSSTSCGYCVGLCNDVPRVKPAQQLKFKC